MFDRYDLHHHSGPSHVTVEEKRAPTDASVRLLREMESKAREQVVESLRLTSVTVEAVVHRYDDYLSCKTKFAVHYKINGQKREVRLEIDQFKTEIRERVEEVWKAVAEDMAAFIIGGIAKDVR